MSDRARLSDLTQYTGGYAACLVLAGYLYESQRARRYPSTPGMLARGGARLWPRTDRDMLERMFQLERSFQEAT